MSGKLEGKTNAAVSIKANRTETSERLRQRIEGALAFSGLIALAPLLALCALLVRASSPGAILFRQQRVGRGGKIFTLYKFRTMRARGGGLLVTADGDARITRLGRFLRKTKLDELPELFNILRGEMSFVGPRPEVPELVDLNDVQWSKILSVRPGITDPVTLEFRNEEDLLVAAEDKEKFYREAIQPYKLKGYCKYLESKSAKNDLKIVFQTLKVVLLPHTAAAPRHLSPLGEKIR